MKKYIIFGFLILNSFFLQNCFLFEDAPRDNPFDPKNPDIKVVRDGLEAWWKFDSGSLADEMGRHNGGSVTSGFIQNALDRFSSSNGAIEAQSTPSPVYITLSGSSVFSQFPFTLEFWVKITGTISSNFENIIDVYLSGTTTYRVGIKNMAGFQFIVGNGAIGLTSPYYQTNEWVHIVLIANSPASFDRYIIKKEETIVPEKVSFFADSPTGQGDVNPGFRVYLSTSASLPLFQIDDLRFYTRPLSKNEVQVNHNAKQ